MINLVFYKLYNFLSQAEDLSLSLGSYKRSYAAFNGSGEGLHKVTVADKFKGHPFYGFFICILYGIQQHTFKIYIGLVGGNRLELQFNGAVLYADTFSHHFNDGYFKTKTRPKYTAELT